MIEILRESPQSTWTLILFFLIIVIYIYLYNDDARRFRYFFLSLFNKQYQVSYGRQSKVTGHFIPLLSLTTFLSFSFLLSSYLGYCSKYSTYAVLFLNAALFLFSFILLKWLVVFMLFVLFKREKLFQGAAAPAVRPGQVLSSCGRGGRSTKIHVNPLKSMKAFDRAASVIFKNVSDPRSR